MLHMPIFVQIIAAISKRNVYNDVQIKVSFVTKFKEYVHFYLHLAFIQLHLQLNVYTPTFRLTTHLNLKW